MRRKLSERERRRIATRRERHGDDFDSRNARHAASFSQTKFNSSTGQAAARKRWQDYREKRAEERRKLDEAKAKQEGEA